MGPRLINRGNKPAARRSSGPRKSFNGAAVDQPRKCQGEGKGVEALMGFNGAAVDQPRKCPLLRRFDGRKPASMGPRLINRGNG